MPERPLLLAGIAGQLAVLAGLIVLRLMPLVYGQTVLLRVVPVDPRDIFRGEYVILAYEFSRTPPDRIEGLEPGVRQPLTGRTVYVALVPEADGVHWRALRVSTSAPEGPAPFLRGTIGANGTLQFGIDAFYVQEGRGREYEDAVRDGRLFAEVAVTPGGWAALRALRIE